MLEKFCLKKIVKKAEEQWKKAHDVRADVLKKYGEMYHGQKFIIKEFRKDDVLDGISVFKVLHTDGSSSATRFISSPTSWSSTLVGR